MRNLFLLAILALSTSSAFATKYECSVGNDPKNPDPALVASGSVTVDCTGTTCSVNGRLSDNEVSPESISLNECRYEQRAVKNPAIAAKQAFVYFDGKSQGCWADYIKVYKSLETSGRGYISLVATSGGDTHDSSGYQYIGLYCQASR